MNVSQDTNDFRIFKWITFDEKFLKIGLFSTVYFICDQFDLDNKKISFVTLIKRKVVVLASMVRISVGQVKWLYSMSPVEHSLKISDAGYGL